MLMVVMQLRCAVSAGEVPKEKHLHHAHRVLLDNTSQSQAVALAQLVLQGSTALWKAAELVQTALQIQILLRGALYQARAFASQDMMAQMEELAPQQQLRAPRLRQR